VTEPTPEERQFVEEIAVLWHSYGFPLMAGRSFGWLLICDPPRQSSGDLAAALGASKGSISTATRSLEATGIITRVAVPGTRGYHYEANPRAFLETNTQRRTFQVIASAMEKGLAVLGDETGPRADRLRQLRDFYVFMDTELLRIIERFWAEHMATGREDA
jgi:DNA-binding transcriptional regulator GbsR (MarR family)